MRTLLVDDHRLFLQGLKNLLTSRGIEVVGTACDGFEAMEKARILKPQLILMDIHIPRLDGLAATRLVKAEQPDVKIVMLTVSESDEDLSKAIKSGACGYLLKTDETEKFFELLSGLVRGEALFSPGLTSHILREFARKGGTIGSFEQAVKEEASLTPRQLEVLTLIAQELTYKEVGAKLFLTKHTIKYHMGEITDHLQLENRRQVIEYARRTKLGRIT